MCNKLKLLNNWPMGHENTILLAIAVESYFRPFPGLYSKIQSDVAVEAKGGIKLK